VSVRKEGLSYNVSYPSNSIFAIALCNVEPTNHNKLCRSAMFVPCAVGYPAVINVTKAASPFSLAASNAASIRPPTPRSMSATAIVSVVATFKAICLRCCLVDCTALVDSAVSPNQVDVLVIRLVPRLLVERTVENAFVVDDTIDQAKQEAEREGKRMSSGRQR
jgi:hypothetical protein